MNSFNEALTMELGEETCQNQALCRAIGRTLDSTMVLGRFVGPIGLPRCNDFAAALRGLVTENAQKIIVELDRVTLSRSAMGVLVGFAAEVHGRNKRLYLYRVSEQVLALLSDLELTYFFSLLSTEDDLVATLVV